MSCHSFQYLKRRQGFALACLEPLSQQHLLALPPSFPHRRAGRRTVETVSFSLYGCPCRDMAVIGGVWRFACVTVCPRQGVCVLGGGHYYGWYSWWSLCTAAVCALMPDTSCALGRARVSVRVFPPGLPERLHGLLYR